MINAYLMTEMYIRKFKSFEMKMRELYHVKLSSKLLYFCKAATLDSIFFQWESFLNNPNRSKFLS